MALVTFVSHRGSPGTTSLALAVAAAWPTSGSRQKVLLEADPAGGVLALRLGIPEDPGLVSLAAAARHGLGRGDLWDHAQALPGGLAVVPGPSNIAGRPLRCWHRRRSPDRAYAQHRSPAVAPTPLGSRPADQSSSLTTFGDRARHRRLADRPSSPRQIPCLMKYYETS